MSGTRKYADYFEDDGRQIEPLPEEWVNATRFKVGDRIEWLEHDLRAIDGGEFRDLKGQIGVVEKVRSGNRFFPSRYIAAEDVWLTDSTGWLTVRFPFDGYGRDADGRYKPRACHLTDEGVSWRRVAEEKPKMTWDEILAAARSGRFLAYKAPLDYRPARVATSVRGKNPKKVRVIPLTGDADPFWADAGHADRFSLA